MTNEEIFDQWCPASSRWSTWAKPVLFTQVLPLESESTIRALWEAQNISWAPRETLNTGIVIDLPGATSVLYSLALAKIGYQPVPLFNCCSATHNEVLPTDQIRDYLVQGAFDLKAMPLPSTVPPAFILDSDRLTGKKAPHPKDFDNRWMTFPQDFPSGNFLRDAGIDKVILLQMSYNQPALDLAQVLMRWQDAGIQIFVVHPSYSEPPVALVVTQPPKYRWFFQRALVMLGLLRNSAGGFGSVIPEPSSGAG